MPDPEPIRSVPQNECLHQARQLQLRPFGLLHGGVSPEEPHPLAHLGQLPPTATGLQVAIPSPKLPDGERQQQVPLGPAGKALARGGLQVE